MKLSLPDICTSGYRLMDMLKIILQRIDDNLRSSDFQGMLSIMKLIKVCEKRYEELWRFPI